MKPEGFYKIVQECLRVLEENLTAPLAYFNKKKKNTDSRMSLTTNIYPKLTSINDQ